MAKPLITNKDIAGMLNESLPKANSLTDETTGDVTPITEINTTNISMFGEAYDTLSKEAQAKFKQELVTLVTRQIFVAKGYVSRGINITRSFEGERGGIVQKVRQKNQYDAQDDTLTYDLVDGEEGNQFTYHSFDVNASYFNRPVSKSLAISIPDKMFKGLFLNVTNVNKFVGMIQNTVDTQLGLHIDLLTADLINTATAAVMTKGKATQKYNLLEEYNTKFGTTLTVDGAMRDKEFMRYAISRITQVKNLMKDYNALYNMGGYASQTTDESAYVWLLNNFIAQANEYLLSDTYHKELLTLDGYNTVVKWQGTGTSGEFEDTSRISIKTMLPGDTTETSFDQTGIIGVICHEDAVAIYDIDERTTTAYNAQREFVNLFPKHDCSTLIDLDEDYVVFYLEEVADPVDPPVGE